MNIQVMILPRGLPKLVSRIVPPIGVNNSGVRKVTPMRPYFFQIKTNLLFLFVNTFFRLKNLFNTFSRSIRPRKVKSKTLLIVPETVTNTVPTKLNPLAYPNVGPAMNFSMVSK